MAGSSSQPGSTRSAPPGDTLIKAEDLPGEAKAFVRTLLRAYFGRIIHAWERVDQFSTWAVGGAVAAIGLIVANLAGFQGAMGPWRVRVSLWALLASLLAGLAQKYFAIAAGVSAATVEASETIFDENSATVDRIRESVAGLSSEVVVRQFLVPFLTSALVELRSGVPKPLRFLLPNSILKLIPTDESTNAKAFRLIVWQRTLVSLQLLFLAAAAMIATTAA